jgi:hypothetical protein
MLDEMALAYNAERTERDYETLVVRFAPDEAKAKAPNATWKSVYQKVEWTGAIPAQYVDIFKDANFPDTVDANAITTAPEYTIDGVKRKGGFQSGGGKKLDPSKVTAARTAPVKV